MNAVALWGGEGMRLRPFTYTQPKHPFPLVIKPVINKLLHKEPPLDTLLVVCTSYMNSVRNKLLNVGDKLRRYEKMDVASHLVCDVISDATTRYIKLQHEDQLRLDL